LAGGSVDRYYLPVVIVPVLVLCLRLSTVVDQQVRAASTCSANIDHHIPI